VPDALYQPFPMPGPARGHIWRYTPEHRRPRHFHLEPELNLVAAGSGKFGVGEVEIAVAAGDLLSWPPGQDHVLLEASEDFDLFVIGLTPELSARVLGARSASPHGGPTCVRLTSPALARLRPLCAVPLERQDPSAVERQVGDLWQDAHALRAIPHDRHTFTRRALVSLIERPELGRTEVATAARAYPTEVSRHFHKDMGLTLTAYRTRLRLLHFIQLVDGGTENFLAAAFEAGFGSYSQCHRAFQQTFTCGPRDFFGTAIREQMEEAFSPWSARPI
jgi:AraC-like DNA-binding protein